MRNSELGSDLHQAEKSSWLIIGSTMSKASGVVGVGEGDLEHAVVDEDDIRIEYGDGEKTEVNTNELQTRGATRSL